MITITAKEISQRLNSRVEGLCRLLYPGGKLISGNWCLGGVGGQVGDSMKIQLTGGKVGLWADFASNESGDLLDLIVAAKGCSMGDAIKFAKDYLNISDPQSNVPPKSYAKPKAKSVVKPSTGSVVLDYLTKERKLNILNVVTLKISEVNHPKFGWCMAYPAFDPAGELVNVKYIAIKLNDKGKKNVWQETGCAPCMFGWHVFDKQTAGQRSIVITEGQLDMATWKEFNVPALSVPDGVANSDWIDYEWENLQQFDTIYLNYDDDEPGQKAVVEVAKRLGLARCLILKLPGHKDANEALQAGRDESYFLRAMSAAKLMAPEKIKSPTDFRDRVMDRFYPPPDAPKGFAPQLLEGRMVFLPGGVSVWTGITSHGKSSALSQTMVEGLLYGEKVAIASMEVRGERTLYQMICQAERKVNPTRDEIDSILGWMGGKVWIYDLLGNVPPKQLFELMYYSYSRHGVTHFVIDSLMKCMIASDDYEAQRLFLNSLCSFAMETNTHIHLVAHSNKSENDEVKVPGKMNVKGSSDIINQADNIIVVYRNTAKEEKLGDGRITLEQADLIFDSFTRVVKQRDTGDQFKTLLRYARGVYRFYPMNGLMADLSILDQVQILNMPVTESQPSLPDAADPDWSVDAETVPGVVATEVEPETVEK